MRVVKLAIIIMLASVCVASMQAFYGYSATANAEVNATIQYPSDVNSTTVDLWMFWNPFFFWSLISKVLTAVFALGVFINSIVPIPWPMQAGITVAVDLIYLWGAVQFITGRGGAVYD